MREEEGVAGLRFSFTAPAPVRFFVGPWSTWSQVWPKILPCLVSVSSAQSRLVPWVPASFSIDSGPGVSSAKVVHFLLWIPQLDLVSPELSRLWQSFLIPVRRLTGQSASLAAFPVPMSAGQSSLSAATILWPQF
jgi:hypothetical protein